VIATPEPTHPSQREASAPSQMRQVELLGLSEENKTAGDPPFSGVTLYNYGELVWIMQQLGWSGEIHKDRQEQLLKLNQPQSGELDADGKERADFRGAFLRGIDLQHASLVGANFNGARLEYADLRYADLRGANLAGTRLNKARLRSAILRWTDLRGTDLREADMSAVDMSGSHLDATTRLGNVVVDADIILKDVVWNGAPLGQINWRQISHIGDENKIRGERGQKKSIAYHDAVRAYRGLSIALESQGLAREAVGFRLRGLRLERRVLLREGRFGEGFLSWISDFVAKYGEAPSRPFIMYGAVVCAFAMGFYLLSQTELVPPFSLQAALVFSVTSFHGRGFFPGGSLSLDDPITLLAATEAFIGLLIELMLIATFSRRFLEKR